MKKKIIDTNVKGEGETKTKGVPDAEGDNSGSFSAACDLGAVASVPEAKAQFRTGVVGASTVKEKAATNPADFVYLNRETGKLVSDRIR